MAKKVTVTLVDDFDGSGAADETVEFGLDGVTYEIDLSTKNATKLRGDLKQWVAAASCSLARTRSASSRTWDSSAVTRCSRFSGSTSESYRDSTQRSPVPGGHRHWVHVG